MVDLFTALQQLNPAIDVTYAYVHDPSGPTHSNHESYWFPAVVTFLPSFLPSHIHSPPLCLDTEDASEPDLFRMNEEEAEKG